MNPTIVLRARRRHQVNAHFRIGGPLPAGRLLGDIGRPREHKIALRSTAP